MKYLFLLFISLNVMASNWMPLSKIESKSGMAYQLESECKKSGEQCLDVDPAKLAYTSLQDLYLKIDEQSCSDESDCDTKFLALVCSQDDYEKIKNLDLLQVYCVKLVKELALDQAGYDADLAAKASAAALESALGVAESLQKCGKRVMGLMLVRNQPKGLTTAQVKSIVSTYAPVSALLDSGSLVSAKEEIQAVTADGVLVTEADKTALVAEINKCLGL